MADDFVSALEVCGILRGDGLMNAVTALQGVSDAASLIALTNKELDQLAVAINKMPAQGRNDPLVLNQITLKRIKALRLWLIWRQRRDIDLDPDDFDEEELQWGLERLDYERRCKEAESPEQSLPDKLVHIGFDVWQTFWRQFSAYCGTIRGAMAIPISYVFRVHDEVTDDMFLANYSDSDEELMATVKLEGPDYQHDNKMVWMILVRLIGSGSAWPFVKHLEASFNAREALKILRTQSLGSASDSSRRARAFHILRTTKYNGKSARFTFNNFIEKLQYAFTELSETAVPQTETQKVEVLMQNVQAESLKGAFAVLLNDPEKLEDFGKATAYFSSYLAKLQAIDGAGNTRTVAAASTASNRTYTDEEWKALPAEEKKSIIASRKKARKKKAGGMGTAPSTGPTTFKGMKRKNAKLTKEIAALKAAAKSNASEESSEDETVVSGSNASGKKKN